MKVLVFLAVFNGQKYLTEQINSILNQCNVNLSILIRDDGSTDGSLEILRNTMAAYSNIKILETDELTGTPAGCFYKLINSVADSEEYDYFAFSDQDDVWGADKIFTAINKLSLGSEGYSSNLIAFNSNEAKTWIVNKSAAQTDLDYFFQGASAGCTYVITKKSFSIVQNFIKKQNFSEIKNISHDWLIYAILRSNKLKWVHDNEAHIFYRQHESNNYGDKRGIHLWIIKYNLFKTGWYRRHINKMLEILPDDKNSKKVSDYLWGFNGFKKIIYLKFAMRFRRETKESLVLFFAVLFGLL